MSRFWDATVAGFWLGLTWTAIAIPGAIAGYLVVKWSGLLWLGHLVSAVGGLAVLATVANRVNRFDKEAGPDD